MTTQEKKDGEGFTVTDRRRVRLDDDGVVQTPDGQENTPEPTPPSAAASDTPDAAASEPAPPADGDLPPLDFTTFVLSLASSAMVHLGEVAHPETGEPAVNIPLARQTIDMLAMLKEKTEGNLTKDEAAYLQAILSDLRMRCVAVCEAKKKA